MSETARLIPRPPEAVLPIALEMKLRRLFVDKFTGNVQLNVKDGKILGYSIEEVVRIVP